MTALAQQAQRLRRSAFYQERLGDRRVETMADLRALPLLTKAELRADQTAHPPFGDHLCADPRDLVRVHVTSGTTGDPVAIGLTRADHEANSRVGGAGFAIAGLRPDDLVAHCLNYALYAGGIADHMALEASGATVVPVGVGQSRRLLGLIPRLGITALFSTLSYPSYLAAQADGPLPAGLRHIVTAGEPGAGLAAVRTEIERAWGVTVSDTFGMSDVWSTMGGGCGQGDGIHLTCLEHTILELIDPVTAAPLELRDGAYGELVWTHLQREASPLLRYRSSDLAHVWTSPCGCGRTTPRITISGRRDDMLRVQAVNVHPAAIGELVGHLGRWRVVATGDPIVPPLRLELETEEDVGALGAELRATLGAAFEVVRLAPRTLPVAEHKTATVVREP